MARAGLLIDLVEAERRGNKQRFRNLVEAIIAEERAKHTTWSLTDSPSS